MFFKIGDRVRNVRRLDNIGVVVSLEAPNNKWMRSEDYRVVVEYPKVTITSNGKWKSGTLDELPIDLLTIEEQPHEAFAHRKRK